MSPPIRATSGADPPASDLPPLIRDADDTGPNRSATRWVATRYGVWKEKSMHGRKFMGIERTTFVIDKDGRVRKVFPKVSVEGHADEVLAALD